MDPIIQAMLDASRGEGYVTGVYAVRKIISDRKEELISIGDLVELKEFDHLLQLIDDFIRERLAKNDI
ncbi:hypothetical protein [Loigolactobacillus zhaoyuanensis]|uniref:hypothetical protein n=1 Tax=Loigolactobacillus zhaoyuanensis TaxID=2486017 RepID=UPI000F73C74C|nr:hypothetical protein [Loigolactobacillus zhaoyuanensis]